MDELGGRKPLWDIGRIQDMLRQWFTDAAIDQLGIETAILEMRDEYEARITELLDAIDSIDREE